MKKRFLRRIIKFILTVLWVGTTVFVIATGIFILIIYAIIKALALL